MATAVPWDNFKVKEILFMTILSFVPISPEDWSWFFRYVWSWGMVAIAIGILVFGLISAIRLFRIIVQKYL